MAPALRACTRDSACRSYWCLFVPTHLFMFGTFLDGLPLSLIIVKKGERKKREKKKKREGIDVRGYRSVGTEEGRLDTNSVRST